MRKKEITISDLKLGQKVMINGMLAEYKGIQKVRIFNLGKAEKRVFKGDGVNIFKYYSIADGSKTLKSEKIKLL